MARGRVSRGGQLGSHASPLTPERREEIRQVLGVLDAVFLGEQGMLEARQRIAARTRAARMRAAR